MQALLTLVGIVVGSVLTFILTRRNEFEKHKRLSHLFWFMFADSETWKQRAIDYRTCYRAMAPNGLEPGVFHNRGAYGHYYAHQAAVKNGY